MESASSLSHSVWQSFNEGSTIGMHGCEGVIAKDEQYQQSTRITLERDTSTAPFAIICGIGGWLVHTRYFSDEDEALSEYEKMKLVLAEIYSMIPYEDEVGADSKFPVVIQALEGFIARFP